MGDLVELEHPRDGAREEGAVVGDDHGAAGALGHEPLEPREAVEVEVVGRLVEQQDVEAAEQDGRQRRARGLPAGERRRLEVEQGGIEPEVAQDRLGPRLEVRAAQPEPRLERVRVALRGARRVLRAISSAAACDARVGAGDAGPPREVVLQPLPGRAVGLLRQVAGRARGELDAAAVRPVEPGEQPQQRRLARAVRTDDAEHVAGRDRHRDAGEDRRGAVRLVQLPRDEGPGHPQEPTTLQADSSATSPGTAAPSRRGARISSAVATAAAVATTAPTHSASCRPST